MGTGKRRSLNAAAVIAVAVLMVTSGAGTYAACCWTFKTCESTESVGCSYYDETDQDDQCNPAQSGWTGCSSGTNDKKTYVYANGDYDQDSTDKDCDGNSTEAICLHGSLVDTEDESGTVTWYGPGATTCP